VEKVGNSAAAVRKELAVGKKIVAIDAKRWTNQL